VGNRQHSFLVAAAATALASVLACTSTTAPVASSVKVRVPENPIAAIDESKLAVRESQTDAGDSGSPPRAPLVVGSPGPDFARAGVKDGRTVSSRALRGKVVIVYFWATWCEPCKKSLPALQKLNARYKASGLEIVGVSVDDAVDDVAQFADSLGVTFPLVWDDGKGMAMRWQPSSMPATFIVDRSGIVRVRRLGYQDGEALELEDDVKGLL
jgi:cytochrome c biogenesis protein CcmG/thiol:disulfide interchange protein DsbE